MIEALTHLLAFTTGAASAVLGTVILARAVDPKVHTDTADQGEPTPPPGFDHWGRP
jgi:hypothetical protein